MKYAIIDRSTGEVVNIVIWDGESAWVPDPGFQAIKCSAEVGPGWFYINEQFERAPS